MMHPSTELKTVDAQVGLGVYATEAIPMGTVLWVRDSMDRVLSEAEVSALPGRLQDPVRRLGYRDASGGWIVCWDGGKHVNHSCEPTMRGVGHDAMIAVRDIPCGGQITCDYAECNLEEALDCLCACPGCRGTIEPYVSPSLWVAWQQEVERALVHAPRVPQPLQHVCVDPSLPRVLSGEIGMTTLSEVALGTTRVESL